MSTMQITHPTSHTKKERKEKKRKKRESIKRRAFLHSFLVSISPLFSGDLYFSLNLSVNLLSETDFCQGSLVQLLGRRNNDVTTFAAYNILKTVNNCSLALLKFDMMPLNMQLPAIIVNMWLPFPLGVMAYIHRKEHLLEETNSD